MTADHLQYLFQKAKVEYVIDDELLQKMHKLDQYLQTRFKLAFGNRIIKQMYDFIPVYVACGGTELGGMDYIIARKVLSARRKKPENRVGNAVTRAVGGVFDGMVEGLNQTVLRGHQIEHHAMARISAAWDGVMDAISQMSHTMSYGLLLFGLGLCVTLLYLMFY